MVTFESDYTTGAHPEILRRLAETNFEPLPGYGADGYCESAKQKIRAAVGDESADVELLAGLGSVAGGADLGVVELDLIGLCGPDLADLHGGEGGLDGDLADGAPGGVDDDFHIL